MSWLVHLVRRRAVWLECLADRRALEQQRSHERAAPTMHDAHRVPVRNGQHSGLPVCCRQAPRRSARRQVRRAAEGPALPNRERERRAPAREASGSTDGFGGAAGRTKKNKGTIRTAETKKGSDMTKVSPLSRPSAYVPDAAGTPYTLDVGAYRFSPDMHLPGDLILGDLELPTECYEPACPPAYDEFVKPFQFNYTAPLRRIVDNDTRLPAGYATAIMAMVDKMRALPNVQVFTAAPVADACGMAGGTLAFRYAAMPSLATLHPLGGPNEEDEREQRVARRREEQRQQEGRREISATGD